MNRTKKNCEKCNREISLSNFKKHNNSCKGAIIKNAIKIEWQEQNGKYKCPHCNKEFAKNGIATHIWKNHTIEGQNHNPNIGFINGTRKGWNKGLTKDTDIRVKKSGETYSKKCKSGEIPNPFKNKKHTKLSCEKMSKSVF
jgi:hypothetical protein